ncbi:MAG: hypothetical protein AVDCRST_MAG13-2268, partial [uncultured Solirubrobacteraceae bacterium]
DPRRAARPRRRLRLRPHGRLRRELPLLQRGARPAVRRPLREDARRGVPGRQPHARAHAERRLRPGVPREQHADRLPGRRRGRRPRAPPRGGGRVPHGALRLGRLPPGDLRGPRGQPPRPAPPLRAAL